MKKGFTLVEIIVYMAVMSVFLLMISQAIMNVSQNRLVGLARSQVASNGNFALEKIRQAVLAASDFTVADNQLTIGNTVYSLDTNSQRLRANATFLTTNRVAVTSLNFQTIGSGAAKTVKITMAIRYDDFLPGGQLISENFTTTVGLR